MKKILWSVMLAAAVTFGFTACEKDNGRTNNSGNEEEETGLDWADYLISRSYTIDETYESYVVAEEKFSEMKDDAEGKTIAELMGYDSYDEFLEAVGLEEYTDEDSGETYYEALTLEGDVVYYGNDPVTGYDIEEYNTNGEGCWLNAAGSLSSWGDDASRIYTESWVEDDYFCAGVRPDHINAGENYVARMVFQKTDGDNVIRVGIEVKIAVEAFNDPESSSYNSANRKTGTFDIAKSVTVPVSTGYDAIWTDLSEIQDYLQLTKFQLSNLVGEYEEDSETGEMLQGLKVQGFYGGEELSQNANGVMGNWMGLDGIGAWGAETGAYFIEMYCSASEIGAGVGTMPDGNLLADLAGSTKEYTFVVTYIPDYNAAATIINIVFTLNFTE